MGQKRKKSHKKEQVETYITNQFHNRDQDIEEGKIKRMKYYTEIMKNGRLCGKQTSSEVIGPEFKSYLCYYFITFGK